MDTKIKQASRPIPIPKSDKEYIIMRDGTLLFLEQTKNYNAIYDVRYIPPNYLLR